jgi:hypothetical protein
MQISNRTMLLFIDISAILPPTRPYGYKEMNLAGVKFGERCAQNHCWTAAAKIAAKYRIRSISKTGRKNLGAETFSGGHERINAFLPF